MCFTDIKIVEITPKSTYTLRELIRDNRTGFVDGEGNSWVIHVGVAVCLDTCEVVENIGYVFKVKRFLEVIIK